MCQPWFPTGEQSGLLTHIATMEDVSLCVLPIHLTGPEGAECCSATKLEAGWGWLLAKALRLPSESVW